jgi:hypothetical protein
MAKHTWLTAATAHKAKIIASFYVEARSKGASRPLARLIAGYGVERHMQGGRGHLGDVVGRVLNNPSRLRKSKNKRRYLRVCSKHIGEGE